MIKSSKKTVSRNRMIRALDDDARQRVFERDGKVCVRCRNRQNGIQWAHIIGRRHLITRWEEDNALTLCGGCHFFWHSQPFISQEWFRKTWPERHEHILKLFNSGAKTGTTFVKERYAELKADPPEKSQYLDPVPAEGVPF